MDRSHLAAEQAARETERLHQECTFKPDLTTRRAAAAVAAAGAVGDAQGFSVESVGNRGLVVALCMSFCSRYSVHHVSAGTEQLRSRWSARRS